MLWPQTTRSASLLASEMQMLLRLSQHKHGTRSTTATGFFFLFFESYSYRLWRPKSCRQNRVIYEWIPRMWIQIHIVFLSSCMVAMKTDMIRTDTTDTSINSFYFSD
jgi:hypothetical protein